MPSTSFKRIKSKGTKTRKKRILTTNEPLMQSGDTLNVIGNIIRDESKILENKLDLINRQVTGDMIRDENKILKDKLHVINSQLATVLKILIPAEGLPDDWSPTVEEGMLSL